MLALFFGVLLLTAVREMRIECRSQDQHLILESGGYLLLNDGGRLRLHEKRRQCEIDIGNIRVPLPAWVRALIE
jgi:hypothetical protein